MVIDGDHCAPFAFGLAAGLKEGRFLGQLRAVAFCAPRVHKRGGYVLKTDGQLFAGSKTHGRQTIRRIPRSSGNCLHPAFSA
jgi:hypothetical protein